MDAAVSAVIGTPSGVVITAVAGLLTATLTARNQRVLAEIQAQREQRKSELIDRRADFATFLQAYDDVFAGGENLFDRVHEGETRLDPRKELFDEIRRFKQAHLMVTITTPAAVRTASDRCLREHLGPPRRRGDRRHAAVRTSSQRHAQASRRRSCRHVRTARRHRGMTREAKSTLRRADDTTPQTIAPTSTRVVARRASRWHVIPVIGLPMRWAPRSPANCRVLPAGCSDGVVTWRDCRNGPVVRST